VSALQDPPWLTVARSLIGQREVPGPASNGWIRSMWLSLKGGAWYWRHYGEDDTALPWCGALTAHCVAAAGLEYPPRYASALAWAGWGEATPGPDHGAIAVLTRNGGGHVGFVTGVSPDGRKIRLLGGNQADAVSEAWFHADRVTAYRLPRGYRAQRAASVAAGRMSTSEA
jgi:uncharacterized protein (TIGR02594 family)